MSKRVWVVGALLVAVVALMFAMPLTASAEHTNIDCELCHGADTINSNTLFDVGAVDKGNCRKCHLDGLVGAHPIHNAGSDCASICHPSYGPSLAANTPTYLDAYGSFASSESADLPSYVLHTIHSTPRWIAGVSTTSSKCGSCHATAACTACHDGAGINTTHADHGNYGRVPTDTPIAPWVGDVSVGVALDQSEDTMLPSEPVLCGSAGCHDTAGAVETVPTMMDTLIPAAGLPAGYVAPVVTKYGTWRQINGGSYASGVEQYSNSVNSSMTLTFTGSRVTLVAARDPYRGIGEIAIDGVVVDTIDQYNSTTQYQRPVWTSSVLSNGQHTITVRVTGSKNASARGAWVAVDAIKVYTSANDTIIPTCASCHAWEAQDDHGGSHPTMKMNFSHDMTQTIVASNTWATGYGTYNCAQCHSTKMRDEHRRSTASGIIYDNGCSVCHASDIPANEAVYATRRSALATAWTGTYSLTDGCNFDGCHSAANPQGDVRVKHGYVVSKHTTTTAGQGTACSACHAGDLRAVHNNPISGNGKVETNGCLVCHGTTKFELDKTCSNCHAGGYNAIATHAIKSTGSHNASETGKAFTRANQTLVTLSDGGYECSLCHSEQLIPAHSNPGTMTAVGCTSGGAGGLGCHMDTAYNSINVAGSGWTTRKCSACHDYGTKRSHDATTAAHKVGGGAGCADSGVACHPSDDLWALHETKRDGSTKEFLGCMNAGCHTSDARPTLASGVGASANSCGSTSPNVGCHQGYTTSHASNYEHTFTSATAPTGSYYNSSNEQGCTNKAGCHNVSSNITTNFAAPYHPNAGCTGVSGKCHGSSSFTAFNAATSLPTECVECHATGAFTNAAARSKLASAPASGGHYSETTHTAVSLNASVTAAGTASARCDQCHSNTVGGSVNGLMNQHSNMNSSVYGATLQCGECHADTAASGNVEVLNNWTNNTCADCHGVTSSLPLDHASTVAAVAEVGSTCGSTGAGCHNSTDLHALHKNAAGGCNLTGCHNYSAQGAMPTAKGCGGATSCHTGYTNATHGAVTNANDALHTATSGMTSALTSGTASATCATCHSATLGSAHATATITSALTSGHTAWTSLCLGCHNANQSPTAGAATQVKSNWTNNACTDCHTGASPAFHDELDSGHTGTSTLGCGATGSGCHNTYNLRTLHGQTRANGCQVTGCHDSVNKVMQSAPKSCGSGNACHSTYTLSSHGGATGNDTTHTAASMTTVLDATYNAGGANTCATCHSAGLEAAHANSITGNLAGPAWTSPMCDECHGGDTSPVTGAVSVIKTTLWPAKSCEECHGGANGPAKHAEYVTGHVGVEAAGCTWNTSCHGNSHDLRVLHNNSVTSNGSTAGCDSAGCHDSANKEMQSASKSCGSGGTCHSDKTHDNHGAASAHGYTAASDYSETTSETISGESGCAGSGAGCHGSIVSRNGVDEFHAAKTAGCTASDACHGNATAFNQTFKDSGSGTDCSRCHDSTAFAATTDDMPLAGASPAGHYSGALHTATGGLGTVTSGGDAGAACSDCHSLDLKDAHGAARTGFSSTTKGAYLTCQECHEYNVSVIAEVKTGSWTLNDCGDCHATGVMGASHAEHGTSAPVVNEVTTTCGSTGINCHNTSDLHALHKNYSSGSAGCSVTGCHDYSKQAFVPTAKSCGTGGACHTGYTKTTHTHAADAAAHQPTALNASNDTSYYSTACGSCHDMRNTQSSLTSEHALATSVKNTNANNCLNCHNNTTPAVATAITNNWSTKDTAGTGTGSACGVCHASGSLAIHTDASATAHVSASTGCAATGVGCHSNDLSSVGATATAANTVIHNSCLRCHSRTGGTSWSSAMVGTAGSLQYNTSAKTCGQATGCHTSTYYTTTTHRLGLGGTITGSDAIAHTATGMTSTITSGVASAACSGCHSSTLLAAHDPAKTTNSLGSAHTAWSSTADTTCQDCHNSTAAPTASAATQVKGQWTNNLCVDCHTPSYHNTYSTGHTGTSTQGCGASGAGCHTTYDLAALHGQTKTNGCQLAGCHDAVDKGMGSAAKSCGSGGTCHNTYTSTSHGSYTNGTDTTHTATAGMASTITSGVATAACSACHGSTLGSAHATTTITSNLGSGHSAWTNLCTDCHNAAAAPTPGAATQVKSSWTTNACTDCHTGSSPAYHNTYASGHTGTSPLGCGASGNGCHTTYDLAALHGQTKTNGCQVTGCHDSINKPMQSAAKSCGSGGSCHGTYTMTSHGTYTNGNDTTHTATAGMTSSLTSGTATATCASCHSATLGSAHATTTITSALTSGHTAWTNLCTGCHNANQSPTAGASTQVKNSWTTNACVDCHTGATPAYHDELDTGHTGTSTLGCGASGAGCHTTYNLRTLHGQTRTNGCQLTGCHDSVNKVMQSASKSCGSGDACHSTYTASSHGGTVTGNETSHTATGMTTVLDATYNAGGANTCDVCHSAGLGNAHKDTSTTAALHSANTAWNSTAQATCSDCHNATSPDQSVTTIKTNSWSAKTCDQCHVTNGNGKHALYATNHVGTESGCSSGSCHGTDLRAIHNNSVTSNASTAGCDAAGCHDKVDKAMGSAAKSCGSTGTCHTDKNSGHGAANHDVSTLWDGSSTASFTVNSITYGPSINVGCGGTAPFNGASAYTCHFSDLVKEHGTSASGGAGRTMERTGVGCGVCHSDKGGTVGYEATDTVISGAITANDLRCETCHKATADGGTNNGVQMGHQTTGAISSNSSQTGVARVGGGEFRSWKTAGGTESSGGHRAFNYLPDWPLRVDVANVNGINPGVLAPLGTFSTTNLNPRTGAAFAFGDVVLCEDCHWYNAAPNGPQGASVSFYVDGLSARPAAGSHWYDASGTRASTPPAPCNKCHVTINGTTHRSAHSINCSGCHVLIPHAWKRPRLLRRIIGGTVDGVAQDVAPYAATGVSGTIGYRVTAGMTGFSDKANCTTNCGAHLSAGTPYWP